MSLENCSIVDFPVIHDPRGNLTFIESGVPGATALPALRR